MATTDFTWIRPAVSFEDGSPGEVTVGMLMPGCFPAYARILHPYWDHDADSEFRWAEMAERTGATIHAEVQWHTLLAGTQGDSRWQLPGPWEGSLEPEEFETLFEAGV